MPKEVKTDADALMLGALIKRLRDLDGRCESVRTLEGEPYLRGKNAVDSFFFAMRDKIGRRNKNDRKAAAGATDILQARINAYQEQKLAEERARREAEERAERERARKAAGGGRSPRRRRPRSRPRPSAPARPRPRRPSLPRRRAPQEQASIAATQAAQAAEKAEDARIATLAKPADMTRVRGNDQSGAGVTLTTAQEPFALLIDRNKVDMEMLRPFFTDAEIEKALRGWAKTTGHRVKMDGAEIGFRNKGVTR
jgi:hypothetical protein